MKWYKIPDVTITGKPFIKKIKAGGKSICLVGYENEIYAVASKCPHAGGDLAYGWCRDGRIVCPLHRYQYDIKTGKGAEGQNDFIDVYPVEKRSDGLYIGVNSFWGRIFG